MEIDMTQKTLREFPEFLAVVVAAFFIRNAIVLLSLSALAFAALTAV